MILLFAVHPHSNRGFPKVDHLGINARIKLAVGVPTYDFAKFPQKLHEIERIWVPMGGHASLHPLGSAND